MGEGHEVDGGQCGRGLIAVDGEHRKIEPGQCDGITADPAAQVSDLRDARSRVSSGVVGRDRQSGGLLQAIGGEEHLLGEGSEFGCGPGAQALLSQGGRHQSGGVPLLAQGASQRQGLGRVVRGQGGQKLPALGRQEERYVVLSHHDRSFHGEPADAHDVRWVECEEAPESRRGAGWVVLCVTPRAPAGPHDGGRKDGRGVDG